MIWLDEVEARVPDGGHVCGSVPPAQAHEVVMEDDVHVPMEAVFDLPVGARGSGELLAKSFAEER